jgi:hypothetical protein
MNTTQIPRHIENRNGFEIKFEIRHNFDNTDHWLHFEVCKDGKVVYSLSDEKDNEALKAIYKFTDSENYRDELQKANYWRNIIALENVRAAVRRASEQ